MCVLLVYLSHIRDPASGYVGNNGFGNPISITGMCGLLLGSIPSLPTNHQIMKCIRHGAPTKCKDPVVTAPSATQHPPINHISIPLVKGELNSGHSQKSLGVQPRPSSKWGPTKNAAFAVQPHISVG